MAGDRKTIRFQLNGAAREVEAFADDTLLAVLRENLGIKSLKSCCSPQRECGSCLALINGKPMVTCAIRAEQAEGKSITTLEGVSDNERRLYADAFQAAAGLQCGFCTPGLVMRIKWMTDQGEKLTRAEIARVLDGHLCRCTGYAKIIDAVELIQEAKRGGALPPLVEDGGVGKPLKRFQGGELALGERPFAADIFAPGLLYGAVVLSGFARARVVRIATAKALARPGVVAVATAKDVPDDRWVGQIYADWPVFVAEGEEVPRGQGCGLATQSDRPLHPGPARGRGTATCAGGRGDDLDPPRLPRPHWPTSHARRRGRVSGRRHREVLRSAGGALARFTSLRRAHGTVLA